MSESLRQAAVVDQRISATSARPVSAHTWELRAGFTLMELVIVLVIVGVLTVGVAPMFGGSLARIRADRAKRDLVAVIRHAGETAIVEGVEYRMYLDAEANAFWLVRFARMDDDQAVFAAPGGPEGDRRQLPEGIRLLEPEAAWDARREAHYIRFRPNGRCDFAVLRVRNGDGEVTRITLGGGLGRIEVAET